MKSKEEKLQEKLVKTQQKNQAKAAKGPKPIDKKWWFYAIIVLALCVIGGIAGSGGNSDNTASDSSSSTTASQESSSSSDSSSSSSTSDSTEMTTAQSNAYDSAKNYLSTQAFSKKGLIDQLSSSAGDGYDKKDAKYAVNLLEKNGEVNWKDEAYQSAKDYLDMESFSLNGLIDQLESSAGDQYTHKQAVYGAKKAYNEK